jgi:hypothetical protein
MGGGRECGASRGLFFKQRYLKKQGPFINKYTLTLSMGGER